MKFDEVLVQLSMGDIMSVIKPMIDDLVAQDIRVSVRIGSLLNQDGSEPVLRVTFDDDSSKVSFRLIHGDPSELQNIFVTALVAFHESRRECVRKKYKTIWHYWDDEYL